MPVVAPTLPEPIGDRYLVTGRLGSGGFATVLRARDRELERDVAIKLQPVGPDRVSLRRFVDEARLLAELSHPGIVRLYDFGTTEAVAYLVMELLEGRSLAEAPPEDPLGAMLEVAEALAAIHARDLVHRDVKPANILRTADDRTVLVDFGLVRDPERTELTARGAIVGTFPYVAPEQFRGSPPSRAGDWYAWGASLFELLEGHPPFTSDSLLSWVQGGSLPVPRFERVEATCPVAELLRRLLSPDPGRRPGSPEEVRALLEGSRAGGPRRAGGGAGDASPGPEGRPEPAVRGGAGPPPGDPVLRPGRTPAGSGPRRWPLGVMLGLGLAGAVFLRPDGSPPADVHWRTLGDAVVVSFRSGNPTDVRLTIDGVSDGTTLEEVEGETCRVRRRLPARREVRAQLLWPGGSSEVVPLVPDRPAVIDRPELAPDRRLRIEVLRPCALRWGGAGEAWRRVEPGFHELSPPASGDPVWRLEWTQDGFLSWHEWTLAGVAEHAIRRLDALVSEVDVVAATTDRFRGRMMGAMGRKVEPSYWGEDPLEGERGAWLPLQGWIPELLASGAPRRDRLRLASLWSQWERYFELDQGFLGVPCAVSVPRGAPGSRFVDLPDWPGARVLPVELRSPGLPPGTPAPYDLGVEASESFGAVFQPNGADRLARAPRALSFRWPETGATGSTPVALCVQGVLRPGFLLRISRKHDPDSPVLRLRERILDYRQLFEPVHLGNVPAPRWFGYCLPADLWPEAGAELQVELDTVFSARPGTYPVHAVQLVIGEGAGPDRSE